MFLKNKNIICKIRRSKVTDYAALRSHVYQESKTCLHLQHYSLYLNLTCISRGKVCLHLHHYNMKLKLTCMGAQWLGCRVLDSIPRGLGFESHRSHRVVLYLRLSCISSLNAPFHLHNYNM